MFPVVARRSLQDLGETRAPKAVIRREIGPAVIRLFVGRQEHRQGPAPANSEHLHDVLVDLIQIRTLLAVDFDIDEILVHEFGDVLAFEGFMLHHMTPVACRVADAEQNGLVFCLGFGQGRLAPCMPIHRIMGVLAEIRTGLMNQAIRMLMFHEVALFLR